MGKVLGYNQKAQERQYAVYMLRQYSRESALKPTCYRTSCRMGWVGAGENTVGDCE